LEDPALTSKERRDLETEWTDERIAKTAALMKASVLLAALVALMWIGLSADTREPSEQPVAATSGEAWRQHGSGSAVTHSREVFEERRARWMEGDPSSLGEMAHR